MWRVLVLVAIANGCGKAADDSKLPAPGAKPSPASYSNAIAEPSARWWCFAAAAPMGRCRATRADCNKSRDVMKAKNDFACRDAPTPEACTKVPASLREISECAAQDHAWCFHTEGGPPTVARVCAPTSEMCNSAHAATLQRPPQGMRVTSDCAMD